MAGKDEGVAIRELQDVGFTVMPHFVPADALGRLNRVARVQLEAGQPPIELEADLQYPGAPASRAADGGDTVRRLLDAYARDPLFAEWAAHPSIARWMGGYFGEKVFLSRAHHNCLMTKHPRYGSRTGWHRDIRYWSFGREDLVSVWIALGNESAENGGLCFVPGSHRLSFGNDRLDDALFFRDDREGSQALLQSAVAPALSAGDAVFFHCNTLHSAGQNKTTSVKFSLVFSYRGASNPPLPGTRSAAKGEEPL